MTHEPSHAGVQHWVKDLNHLHQSQPALHERDFSPDGFQWIDFSDADNSTLFFLRCGRQRDDVVLAVFNFTPVPRHNYRVGVPRGGYWKELLNSDAQVYGGSGQGNSGGVEADSVKWHHQPNSLRLTFPCVAPTAPLRKPWWCCTLQQASTVMASFTLLRTATP